MLKRIFLAAVILAAGPSYATVDVAFVNPEKFADASNQRWEMQGTLDAIAQHMKRTGDRYIAPNETLKIEVLDHIILGRKTHERSKDFSSLRELGYFYN